MKLAYLRSSILVILERVTSKDIYNLYSIDPIV